MAKKRLPYYNEMFPVERLGVDGPHRPVHLAIVVEKFEKSLKKRDGFVSWGKFTPEYRGFLIEAYSNIKMMAKENIWTRIVRFYSKVVFEYNENENSKKSKQKN